MAQPTYTPIQIYYSTTAAAVPVNTNLASGELAINIADGLLFYKDNLGAVQKIGYKLTPTTAGGTGLTAFTANGVVYASSTSALATGSALVFDGTNLGLGVTPSTWTNLKVLETGYSSSFGGNIASSVTYVVSNGYFNGGWLYKTTGPAAYYRVDGSTGSHVWYNAPSGTAGNAITFTQAMTLNSSGQRMLGITTPYGIDTVSTTVDNGVAVATNISAFSGAISVIHNQDNPGTGNKNGLFFAHAGAPGLLSGIASTKLSGTWQTTLDFYVNNITGVNTGDIQLAARIDSSGNLGIGTTSPGAKLEVNQAATAFPGFKITGSNSPGMQIVEATGVTAHFVNDSAGVYVGSSTSYPLILRTNNTERARFNTTGALVFAGGTTTANGIGITFPATQSASTDANTLDDYEEGTWTPLMSANGGGSDNWTSSTAIGRYTRIGRLVSIQCTYTYTAKQTLTGDYAWMTGFPFTPTVEVGYFYVGINNSGGADTATYSGSIFVSGIIGFIKDQNQSSPGYMVGSDFPAATRTITFQAMYIV